MKKLKITYPSLIMLSGFFFSTISLIIFALLAEDVLENKTINGALSYFIVKSENRKITKKFLIMISIIFIIMIGISRMYLNAHYPSDVFSGYIAGFTWLLSCIYARKFYEKRII